MEMESFRIDDPTCSVSPSLPVGSDGGALAIAQLEHRRAKGFGKAPSDRILYIEMAFGGTITLGLIVGFVWAISH